MVDHPAISPATAITTSVGDVTSTRNSSATDRETLASRASVTRISASHSSEILISSSSNTNSTNNNSGTSEERSPVARESSPLRRNLKGNPSAAVALTPEIETESETEIEVMAATVPGQLRPRYQRRGHLLLPIAIVGATAETATRARRLQLSRFPRRLAPRPLLRERAVGTGVREIVNRNHAGTKSPAIVVVVAVGTESLIAVRAIDAAAVPIHRKSKEIEAVVETSVLVDKRAHLYVV